MPALPLQEAYLALQSITVPERQRDCLQQLVTRLCSRGEVAMLCSLPFADACVRREHGRSGRAQCRLPALCKPCLLQAFLQCQWSHAAEDASNIA